MQRGAFAAPALHAELEALADKRDRSLATDLTYGTIRWQLWLNEALLPHLKAPDRLPERVLAALQIGTYEILKKGAPRFAVVNEWVGIIKKREPRLSGLVNAVLRKVAEPAELSAAGRYSLPQWLWDEFQASLGADGAERAAAGMLEPEPLWLAALQPQAAEILRVEDNEVWDGPVKGSLGSRLSIALGELESYLAGLVQPMNPTSLLAARLLGAGAGDRVLDLASGNGLKAAVLAAMGADVTSVEVDRDKQVRAMRNQKRLQVSVKHVKADLRDVPRGLEPAPFVLLDAPCTGTGTLRGNPEIKLRLRPEAVTQAAALQSQMLETAAALTAPGGLLLYAVCSLTQAEGPGVVDDFLASNPEFQPESVAAAAAAHLQGEAASTVLPVTAAGAWVIPERGLDGFHLALLRRRN